MAKRNNNHIDGQSETVVYVNVDYLLSIPSLLKILEFLFLIAAMGCMIQYDNHWTGYPSELIFFHVVVVMSWLVVLALFIMMLLTLEKKLPGYDWNLCTVFISVVLAVFLIAVSGLMANEARKHQDLEWNDVVFSTKIKVTLDHLVAAVVLAMLAALVFIIDAILHLVKFFRERRRRHQFRDQ